MNDVSRPRQKRAGTVFRPDDRSNFESGSNSNPGVRRVRRHQALWMVGLGVLVVASVATVIIFSSTQKKPAASQGGFPAAALNQVQGFQFYYLKPSFSTDFVLDRESISYQNGVMIFQMRNTTGKTLAITEQRTPQGFDTSSLQGDKDYSNEYGQAFISDLIDRTTGALFTTDGTWILVNAPSPIGLGTMQDILDNLSPQHLP